MKKKKTLSRPHKFTVVLLLWTFLLFFFAYISFPSVLRFVFRISTPSTLFLYSFFFRLVCFPRLLTFIYGFYGCSTRLTVTLGRIKLSKISFVRICTCRCCWLKIENEKKKGYHFLQTRACSWADFTECVKNCGKMKKNTIFISFD